MQDKDRLKICGSVNSQCIHLNPEGICCGAGYTCPYMVSNVPSEIFGLTRIMTQSFRELYRENMELKKLMLKTRQDKSR